MFVDHLSLDDFRSYERVQVDLTDSVTVFVGSNGQGKTNLVEAVEYLSTLASHRVSADGPLVRAGAEQAIVRAGVVAGRDDPRRLLLEIEINPGRANRARLNRAPQRRARDVLGVLRSVIFTPDDLAIVKGDPADRRAFLDSVVITRWPRMAGVKADFERVLKQRNSLLKALSGRGPYAGEADPSTLEIWNEQLAVLGGELLDARLDTLDELMPRATEAYAAIAPVNNVTSAEYRSSFEWGDERPGREGLIEAALAAMQARRSEELARGVSLIGPHRDDVLLSIGDLPAKGYASHGESWSLALALKLGAFQLLRADGIEPVLILDDVFAELDVTRRDRLAAAVVDAEQVLVTAAVASDVPEALAGAKFFVQRGHVRPVSDNELAEAMADWAANAGVTEGGDND